MGPNQTFATKWLSQEVRIGPSLGNLQHHLISVLVKSDTLSCGLLRISNRIEIYRQSIQSIHIKALRSTYPICYQLVGEQFFDAMAKIYIKKKPSRTKNLYEYGEDFAEFIANFPPAQCLAYLSDVARLEWAWLKAFKGPDYTPWNALELLSVSEEHHPYITFYLAQNSSLLESPFPIHRIWEAHQNGTFNDLIYLDEGSVKLLIVRQNREVYLHVLSDMEWSVLLAIQKGNLFSELYPNLDTLQGIIKKGWIERIDIAC